MHPSPLDWAVRTAMLVLAGLVSLSLLGAVAALTTPSSLPPATTAGGAPALDPAAVPESSTPQPDTVPQENGLAPEGQPPAAGAGGEGVTVAAAPPPEPDPLERWLEAIAYALLALAGLAAIGVLLLWRLLVELRRRAP